MPRKNARPAARKALARKRAAKDKPKKPKVGMIAHHTGPNAATLALIVNALMQKDRQP